MLSAAAFVYVTAELAPVGALPAIAADLHVSNAVVGTLLASYALVAAITTVPLVQLTARWPRRRILALTLVSLTVSQVISALAPDFAVLACGRVLCALTHGLMWSVIAPIGIRLVPASHAGRATTAVYLGTSLALVVGSPLTAEVSQLFGWRVAVAAVAAAAGATLAALTVLPQMAPAAPEPGTSALRRRRSRRVVALSVLTFVGVTGHFISYTYIAVIIRDVVKVPGPHLGWPLVAYGVAGLASMALIARPLDRRPKASVVACLVALTVAFAVLTGVAFAAGRSGPTLLIGISMIVLWGASATALPPMLQSVVMRSSPEDPEGASSLYIAAFQVGIMAGSVLGGLLYDDAGVGLMLAASTVLVFCAMVAVAATRKVFV